jgi:hypothetical protein
MTKLEKRASDYSYENYIDYVDAWGEHNNTFHDIKDAYVDGAEYMLRRVLTFMRTFQNGNGEFPLYDYIGNVREAMEE